MGIAGSALSLIRSAWNRGRVAPQPYMSPVAGQTGYQEYGNYLAGMGGTPATGFNDKLHDSVNLNADFESKLRDYSDMNSYPELGIALNIYADEATQQSSTTNQSIWIESPNEEIEEILNHLLHKQLEIEEDLWSWARQIAQKGNLFLETIVFDEVGVVKLIELPAEEVRRVADKQGNDFGYIYDENRAFCMSTDHFVRELYGEQRFNDIANQQQETVKVLETWEVAHFRLRSGTNGAGSLYGESILEPSRWVWKRIQMMEDAMVLYKLTRSPQRYVFYIDVGNMPPNQVKAEIQRVKNEFKKNKMVDPRTGEMSFNYNPLSVDEDFFIAKRQEKRTSEVEILSGLDGQQVDDAEYFRDKLFSSLGIPKSYLGADETIGRANLGQMDVRFAKTIMRVQRAIKNGVRHICDVDLATRNIDPGVVEYEVKMVIPSGALEIAQIEVERAKVELAQQYQQMNFPDWYVWTKVLGLSEDEARSLQSIKDASMPPSEGEEGVEKPPEPQESKKIYKGLKNLEEQSAREQAKLVQMMEKKNDKLMKSMNELRKITYDLRSRVR